MVNTDYEELREVIRSGDHFQSLSVYAGLIEETISYVVSVEVKKERSYMLESIKNQKIILEKAELLYESMKSENFPVENTEKCLDNFCDALKDYDVFVKDMREKNIISE